MCCSCAACCSALCPARMPPTAARPALPTRRPLQRALPCPHAARHRAPPLPTRCSPPRAACRHAAHPALPARRRHVPCPTCAPPAAGPACPRAPAASLALPARCLPLRALPCPRASLLSALPCLRPARCRRSCVCPKWETPAAAGAGEAGAVGVVEVEAVVGAVEAVEGAEVAEGVVVGVEVQVAAVVAAVVVVVAAVVAVVAAAVLATVGLDARWQWWRPGVLVKGEALAVVKGGSSSGSFRPRSYVSGLLSVGRLGVVVLPVFLARSSTVLPCRRFRLAHYQVSPSPPPLPAPHCLPCVEGRQRAAPHSSSFPPTIAPLQTLHLDVWGPARRPSIGPQRYFLLVVDDYTR
ncbi:unnamed protein product [Closterium sp. NIES-64]|nr:unnamed protein product [Closterium sp. NIES-64]